MPDQKPDPLPAEVAADIPFLQVTVKAEDRLSTGSGGSAVVDHEDGPQPVDSGDSYFPNNDYPDCIGPVDQIRGVHSEENDGRSYFSHVFVEAAEQQQQQTHEEEGEPLGWWVWS